ncbi:MAG: hypothetical protein WBB22_12075 [Anaerolineae bacterium]
MIRAMIFDLDGTLVQTERLKALSYARAVAELCGNKIREPEVIDAFRDPVGPVAPRRGHTPYPSGDPLRPACR